MSQVDKTFLAAFQERVEAQGISRHFGLELEELGPGRARVGMSCRPEMANILGMVHGTAIFALIDEAFQAACNAHGTVAVALYYESYLPRRPPDGGAPDGPDPGTPRRAAHRHLLHRSHRPPGESGGLLPGPGLP